MLAEALRGAAPDPLEGNLAERMQEQVRTSQMAGDDDGVRVNPRHAPGGAAACLV